MRSLRPPKTAVVRLAAVAGGVVLAGAVTLPAGPAPQDRGSRQGTAVIRAMLQKYRRLTSLDQQSVHSRTMDYNGRKDTETVSVRLAYQKPNRILYRAGNADGGMTLACDGTSLWRYSTGAREYSRVDAPTSMAEMGAMLGERPVAHMTALAFLMGYDPLDGARSVRLAGSGKLSGRMVDIVELRAPLQELSFPDSTTRLYIGKADRLLWKTETRATRGTPPEVFRPGARPGTMRIVMTKTNSAVRVNQAIASGTFGFQPPRGTRRLDRL